MYRTGISRRSSKSRSKKSGEHLFVAAGLDLGSLSMLQSIPCNFLCALGGFGCLVFGFLTTLRILGCVFPKRANLDMLMSGKNELQKMKRHTYFIASLLVFPGCSARYVFMCSLTKRLYADGARLAFPSADKDVNIRAYTSEMGVPTFFGLGIGATSSCLGRGFCRGCSEEVKKREVTEYILPIAVLAIPSECSANERKRTLLYYQSRGLNILERETRSTESACHHGVTCQGPCATRSKHSIYLWNTHRHICYRKMPT